MRGERGLADSAQPVHRLHHDSARYRECLVQPREFTLAPDEQGRVVGQVDHSLRSGGRQYVRLRGQRQRGLGVHPDRAVPADRLPDGPSGGDGPFARGSCRNRELRGRALLAGPAQGPRHESPVDADPMSPPAAIERSPEAVTLRAGGVTFVGVGAGAGAGGAGVVTASPATATPIPPPAGTDRTPDAVTAVPEPPGVPRNAWSVSAGPISPAAPATQGPIPVHTNVFDLLAIRPS